MLDVYDNEDRGPSKQRLPFMAFPEEVRVEVERKSCRCANALANVNGQNKMFTVDEGRR